MENSVGNRHARPSVWRALRTGACGALAIVCLGSAWTPAQEAPNAGGVPPEQQQRIDALKAKGPGTSLTILPVRIGAEAWDRLTEVVGTFLEKQGLQSIELGKAAFKPEDKADMARLAVSLGEFVRKIPVDADYILYADYRFNPENWEQGYVHFIVCDRKGEWVLAELANSHHPDYQSIEPISREDCDQLLVKRLGNCLK